MLDYMLWNNTLLRAIFRDRVEKSSRALHVTFRCHIILEENNLSSTAPKEMKYSHD
jgi:hypothetical protein